MNNMKFARNFIDEIEMNEKLFVDDSLAIFNKTSNVGDHIDLQKNSRVELRVFHIKTLHLSTLIEV